MNLRAKAKKLLLTATAVALGSAVLATPAQAGTPSAAHGVSARASKAADIPSAPILAAISPDGNAVLQWSSSTGWTQIGGPAANIISGGGQLITTDPRSGDAYLYNGSPNNWTRISDPAWQFAIDSYGHVYKSVADAGVFQWTGGTNWTKIGGIGGNISAGGAGKLVVQDPGSGLFYNYNGTPNSWSWIGGPYWQVVVDGKGAVFGEANNGIFQWNGGRNWTRIGDSPAMFTPDSSGLLVSDSTTGDVSVYNGSPNNWSRISGPAAELTVDGAGTVYRLSKDSSDVSQWTGGTNWTTIGGPAGWLAAS